MSSAEQEGRLWLLLIAVCIAAFLFVVALSLPRDSQGCSAWPCEPVYCDDTEPCPEECACRDFVCEAL